MMVRLAMGLALASAVFLTGCGAGDSPGVVQGGVLNVTRGGSGSILFPQTQTTLNFSDSVTVAIRGVNDSATQFTIYTLFGLNQLTLRDVPSAALVTFINGLSPAESSSTTVPSTVVLMSLHTGFDRSQVAGEGAGQIVLAQDAPSLYDATSNGAFVLEPQPFARGTFVDQASPDRRARWSIVTQINQNNGAEALIDGAVNYVLSTNVSQEFLGYAGNLGLLTKPSSSGGGPPPPPGTSGGGGSSGSSGGTSGSGSDTPPSPPL